MNRNLLGLGVVALTGLCGLGVALRVVSADGPRPAAAREAVLRKVPLKHVVLFNTGVGYYHREGDIDGAGRIDLTFPATDVNDLLKTLTIDDGGKPGVVSFDGTEPLETSLRSFAIDLSANPTLGQILNQARGAKVEVVQDGTGGTAGTPITGTIVGMEAKFENPTSEVHHLNLSCSDGMKRVNLDRVFRIRFLDAQMEEEFRRALAVLGGAQNENRRGLSLHLKGDEKRNVKIGYVVESPIWKATYRLRLGDKPEAAQLRSWAIVQNSTDEDWQDVKLTLVSGRPITFKMDLAQPLFVPRPTIENEVYASLRPPVHQGGPVPGMGGGNGGLQGGLQLGLQGGGLQLGLQGGFRLDDGDENGRRIRPMFDPSQPAPGGLANRYQMKPPSDRLANRLSYEELMSRRDAVVRNKQRAIDNAHSWGGSIAAGQAALESIALDADRIGEGFRLSAQTPLSLTRQKSAMVPLVDSAVGVERISVYNRGLHPRFPFRSARVKNTTGQHLQQGPLAVYDGESYLGDARLPDLAPNQERLVSFAMDLGVEVKPDVTESTPTKEWRLAAGLFTGSKILTHVRLATRKTHYRLTNRGKEARAVIVEHPHESGWEFAATSKPKESTETLHRFVWKLAPGESRTETVELNAERPEQYDITSAGDGVLERLLDSLPAKHPARDEITRVQARRKELTEVNSSIGDVGRKLVDILAEQDRLRSALRTVPDGTPLQKKYLEKLEIQEKELDTARSARAALVEKQKALLGTK